MSIRDEITAEVAAPLTQVGYEDIIYRNKQKNKSDKDKVCKDKDDWVKKVKAEYQKQAYDKLPRELEKLMFDLPSSRLNSHSNRSYFVKSIAYSILIEQNRIEEWAELEPLVIQLALCSEMMITVQYYHNFIFDGKNGVNTPLLVRETLIKSNLLKSWLFRYIDRAFSSFGYSTLIGREVDAAFNNTDIGQFIEGRYNSFEYFTKKELDNDILNHFLFEDNEIDWNVIDDCISIVVKKSTFSNFEYLFLKLYFVRLYLISTALYQTNANVLISILKANEIDAEKTIKFSRYYGIMMQIVNDNNDFVPGYMDHDTKAKYPQDQQSDIRNKNFTLPLFLFFHYKGKGGSYIQSTLESQRYKGYSERREKLIFEEIKPVLVQYSIPIGVAIAEKAAFYVNNNSHLTFLTKIANDNRFYRIIFNKPNEL